MKYCKSKIVVKRGVVKSTCEILTYHCFAKTAALRFFIILLSLFFFNQLQAQLTVSGTVYDISKNNLVENVRVVSTGGIFAITDSMGRYSLMVSVSDSLTFIYNNKPTQKFAVAAIRVTDQFDISLKITVPSRYSLLKEVKVFSRSYKQDSLENRHTYADVFEYKKPGIHSSMSGGVAGADLDELINIFRFRRNRQIRAFQQRLEIQEQDKYVDYRFNKIFVKRITGLQPPDLDSFLIWYRPSYQFVSNSSEITFNQYILDASYNFLKMMQVYPARKEGH